MAIQVGDEGQGMDGHTLSHAMDPLFSTKKAGWGTGMGLTGAQQYAGAHGGRIELHSTHGEDSAASLIISLDSTDANHGS